MLCRHIVRAVDMAAIFCFDLFGDINISKMSANGYVAMCGSKRDLSTISLQFNVAYSITISLNQPIVQGLKSIEFYK